jgi:GNAT superfamily N-acetyltransferase
MRLTEAPEGIYARTESSGQEFRDGRVVKSEGSTLLPFRRNQSTMLEDYPKEIVIKDGTPVLLRPVTKEDEKDLNAFFASIPQEEKWFLRDDIADPAIMHDWLQNLDYRLTIPMIAVREADGFIIANLRIHRRQATCLTHVAHLRIMVHPEYRGQRLGTWMLLDAVRLAMSIGIEKLVAEFVVGVEASAIKAAHRLDFFEQAVLKDYVKDRNGVSRDLMIMIKNVHSEWSDF